MTGPARVPPPRPPARCTCASMTVATLAETLGCPLCWYELPGGSWRHAWRGRVRGISAGAGLRSRQPAQVTP